MKALERQDERSDSINIIRKKINDNKPIITCHYINNSDQLSGLLDVIRQLEKDTVIEVKQTIRNTSRIINTDVIRNLLLRDMIVERQIEELDDNLTK
ncbi:hypothetical protein CHH51_04355 [Terribacillus saccharophilus]|nr:hypothetical protein CHH51_04355 [Terribacillus saccharophilus]